MGKTSWLTSVASNVAMTAGKTVALFSLEMSGDQMVQRLISAETGISTHKLRVGEMCIRDRQSSLNHNGSHDFAVQRIEGSQYRQSFWRQCGWTAVARMAAVCSVRSQIEVGVHSLGGREDQQQWVVCAIQRQAVEGEGSA